MQLLHKRGVEIALGSDTWKFVPAGEGTIRELELMVDAGLSPAEVIKAATHNAANHLGILNLVMPSIITYTYLRQAI